MKAPIFSLLTRLRLRVGRILNVDAFDGASWVDAKRRYGWPRLRAEVSYVELVEGRPRAPSWRGVVSR